MNLWLLSAGILCGLTFLIHTFSGQSLVRSFLSYDLPQEVKGTLFACWHMVTLMLFLTTLALLLSSVFQGSLPKLLLTFIAVAYNGFGLVFLVTGWFLYRGQGWRVLPQWGLLVPIGLLTWPGI